MLPLSRDFYELLKEIVPPKMATAFEACCTQYHNKFQEKPDQHEYVESFINDSEGGKTNWNKYNKPISKVLFDPSCHRLYIVLNN